MCSSDLELAELQFALQQASCHRLKVWIESVPIGWSDGQTWRVPAHCQACGAEWSRAEKGVCSECAAVSSFQGERRMKVLGLRPFIQLSKVLGPEPARRLFGEYLAGRNPLPRSSSGSG